MKEELYLVSGSSKSCSTGLPLRNPWTKSDETGQPLVSAGITEVRRDTQKAMFRRSRKKQIRMAKNRHKTKKRRSHTRGDEVQQPGIRMRAYPWSLVLSSRIFRMVPARTA